MNSDWPDCISRCDDGGNMADSTSPERRSSHGTRLFLEVVLLLLIGLAIYFVSRDLKISSDRLKIENFG